MQRHGASRILRGARALKSVVSETTSCRSYAAAAPALLERLGSGNKTRVWPSVRRLLSENPGLDIAKVAATGPRGTVTKADILAALAGGSTPQTTGAGKEAARSPGPAPATARPPAAAAPAKAPAAQSPAPPSGFGDATFSEETPSNVRKIIASRLLDSKLGSPHLYVSKDIVLDDVLALRKQLAANGVKVSVNDLIVKAAALALRAVPEVNVTWDAQAQAPSPCNFVDISIAVSVPGGLMTPIVRGADKKTLQEISADIKQLASRAREGKLKPEEYQGGSFSISNLGMFEVSSFQAILNPPQGAILAVGRGEERLTVVDGVVKTVNAMTATMSVDQRSVQGAAVADWLNAFQGFISHPEVLAKQ